MRNLEYQPLKLLILIALSRVINMVFSFLAINQFSFNLIKQKKIQYVCIPIVFDGGLVVASSMVAGWVVGETVVVVVLSKNKTFIPLHFKLFNEVNVFMVELF